MLLFQEELPTPTTMYMKCINGERHVGHQAISDSPLHTWRVYTIRLYIPIYSYAFRIYYARTLHMRLFMVFIEFVP